MKKSIETFLFYYVPPILWMAAIFWFSAQPGLTLVEGNVEADAVTRKFGHLFQFGFLAFLAYRVFAKRFSLPVVPSLALGSLFSLLYAASDEFHQSFVSMREGTVRDWSYDAAGVVVFLMVFYLIRKPR